MKNVKFIKCFILSLLLFAATPSFSKEVKFAQITDIHYSLTGETQSTRNISQAGIALQAFVHKINDSNVDFIMFLGDSIDSSNTEELEGFMNVVKDIKKPYYMIIGNHDAHKASGISKEDYLTIVRKYNKNQFSKESYFSFNINPELVAVIMDGTSNTVPTARGNFNNKKLLWLDKTLTKNKDKKVLIFQHYPLVEPADNVSHSIINKEAYFNILKKHNNVVLVSSGHYHGRQVKRDEQGIMHISTPAFYDEPFQYDVIKINYDKKSFSKVENVTVEIQEEKCL